MINCVRNSMAASSLVIAFLLLCGHIESPHQATKYLSDFDTQFYAQVPLSERQTAMGATDPAWSPDGKEIAFSMMGSLWRMPVRGGEAVQVTTERGYDSGVAWSPDGRWLGFVRGQEPIRGVQIGAIGKLMIIELESGQERTLAPELQFVGVPCWTAESSSLVINRIQGRDVSLVEVKLSGGDPRALTGPPLSRVSTIVQRGSGWYTFWYPMAIHPQGGEIAFGGDRDGTPQLWRMPLREGLVITSKLSNYRERDQVDIQDLTWQDPSTILFSANLHNQRTNFDLWRWKKGSKKKVERVTRTLTDEFSPRVSPDGQTVLFVSNYLGNLDLFATDSSLGPARHIAISGLRFKNGSARLMVRLRNESQEPVAARVSVRAEDGKFYSPPGSFYRYHGGMGESAGFFHASGDFELTVPAGQVQISAFRGIEYEPVSVATRAQPGNSAEASLLLKRFTSWQGNGWWSGEDHIHANYAGPYYVRPEDVLTMLEAEDLNIANMLVANAEGERPYDLEFFEGKPDGRSNDRRIMYWNEEYRNRIVYGHMALLNLKQLVGPIFTSFEGSPHPYDYPSNTMAAKVARDQGATVAYVHPILGQTRDPFDFPVSAKELPVTAALGLVDVIDVYPWGPMALEVWYKLMNCGLRVAPGAGTDTFSNWRTMNQVPGNSRVYVQASGPLSYKAWIRGLKEGRSFVTNGPLLTLEVNGKGPGEILKIQAGNRLQVRAKAESRLPLKTLELIVDGKVVTSKDGDSRDMGFEWNTVIAESGWLALRSQGTADIRALGQASQAHTAAIYFEVDGKPMRGVEADAQLFVDWIDRLSDLIEMRNNFENPKQKNEVMKLVLQARKFYVELVRRGRANL